jgi:hypothetical protein
MQTNSAAFGRFDLLQDAVAAAVQVCDEDSLSTSHVKPSSGRGDAPPYEFVVTATESNEGWLMSVSDGRNRDFPTIIPNVHRTAAEGWRWAATLARSRLRQ